MIRGLRLTDLPLQLLPGRLAGEDQACTHGELGNAAHRLTRTELARWSLSASPRQLPLAAVHGSKLDAVGVLRTRQGPRSWEVAHLFVDGGCVDELTTLLEGAVAHIGARGAERLFLRTPLESPVVQAAKRAGFFPAFTEEVFALNRPMMVDPHSPPLLLRPLAPSDTVGLFWLYNRTQTASVRAAAGLTMDQWLDSREPCGNEVRDYVWERGGQLRGWVRFDGAGDVLTLDAALHPDEGAVAPRLVTYAARLAWGHKTPRWVVPSHQPAIGRALQQRGWQVRGSYAVLILPTALRVREPSLTFAQA